MKLISLLLLAVPAWTQSSISRAVSSTSSSPSASSSLSLSTSSIPSNQFSLSSPSEQSSSTKLSSSSGPAVSSVSSAAMSSALSSLRTSSTGATNTTLASSASIPAETEPSNNDQHGNVPPIELTAEESVNSTALDLSMYAALFTSNPLAPVSSGDSWPMAVLPACPNIAAYDANAKRFLDKRPKRPALHPCLPTSLTIDIYFNYVANGILEFFPPSLATRINKQVNFMNKILNPYGIQMRYDGQPGFSTNVDFTYHTYYSSDLTTAKQQQTKKNNDFKRTTRIGGADAFNVWIVNDITDLEGSKSMNGYSYFPEWRKFAVDGAVLNVNALRTEDDAIAASNPRRRGGTLIHEFGHWMGLIHQFGDSDCGSDDGIADTYQFSGAAAHIHDCQQQRCKRPNEALRRVQNWMSYSECRGVKPGTSLAIDYQAFSPGQRAAMFSRFLQFRQGKVFSTNFCANAKRSIQKRDEDSAKVLADFLLNNCTVAIQDAYEADTVPLPSSALSSISSAASSLSAHPKPTNSDPDAFVPVTAAVGTATTTAGGEDSVPTATGSRTSSKTAQPTATSANSNGAGKLEVQGALGLGLLGALFFL